MFGDPRGPSGGFGAGSNRSHSRLKRPHTASGGGKNVSASSSSSGLYGMPPVPTLPLSSPTSSVSSNVFGQGAAFRAPVAIRPSPPFAKNAFSSVFNTSADKEQVPTTAATTTTSQRLFGGPSVPPGPPDVVAEATAVKSSEDSSSMVQPSFSFTTRKKEGVEKVANPFAGAGQAVFFGGGSDSGGGGEGNPFVQHQSARIEKNPFSPLPTSIPKTGTTVATTSTLSSIFSVSQGENSSSNIFKMPSASASLSSSSSSIFATPSGPVLAATPSQDSASKSADAFKHPSSMPPSSVFDSSSSKDTSVKSTNIFKPATSTSLSGSIFSEKLGQEAENQNIFKMPASASSSSSSFFSVKDSQDSSTKMPTPISALSSFTPLSGQSAHSQRKTGPTRGLFKTSSSAGNNPFSVSSPQQSDLPSSSKSETDPIKKTFFPSAKAEVASKTMPFSKGGFPTIQARLGVRQDEQRPLTDESIPSFFEGGDLDDDDGFARPVGTAPKSKPLVFAGAAATTRPVLRRESKFGVKASPEDEVTQDPEVRTTKKVIAAAAKDKKKKKAPVKKAASIKVPEEVSTAPLALINEDELLAIIRRPAFSAQERYEVLEARDKLMRARVIGGVSGGILCGVCPDLCPEKERYSRVAKKQLPIYERLSSGLDEVNHRAAVKEYSRSSADQDVPLPHDLRPESVLSRAMDHILCNIVDRVDAIGTSIEGWFRRLDKSELELPSTMGASVTYDENESLGDWFQYIWGATRAIRKDITQQQLTTLGSVALVEKCARFHIVCAERLVEEDIHDFSPKLNDENLTKCLQTLKHMYEDLRLEGVRCPNEPEFRSYDLLMNLNDGDSLRAAVTLDSWVRRSPPVRLAIDLFMALDSHNYAAFFKLVRKATLLQGCLLPRYFYQVRKRALSVMVHGFTTANGVTQFPIARWTTLLGFEDMDACAHFFGSHGFVVSDDRSPIINLSRRSFYHPEEVPAISRARNLVESKRGVAWSEVINGEPLPPNPYTYYKPHDSFDSDGRLKLEAYEAADQSDKIAPASPEDKALRRARLQRQESIDRISKDILSEVLEAEVNSVVDHLCRDFITELEDREKAAEEITEEIFIETVEEQITEVASDARKEAMNMELADRLKAEARTNAAENIVNDLIGSHTSLVAREIASEVLRNLAQEKRVAMAEDVWKDLVEIVLAKETEDVAKEALGEAVAERKKKIKLLRKKRQLRIVGRVFKSWKIFAQKQARVSRILTAFPNVPASLLPKEQNTKLGGLGHRITTVKEVARRKKRTADLFAACNLADKISEKVVLQPLDLSSLVAPNLPSWSSSSTSFWKCLLCLPSMEHMEEQDELLCQMLKRKFSSQRTRLQEDPNLLCCFKTAFEGGRTFGACVRVIDGDILEQEITASEKKRRELLQGTSCVLFVYFDTQYENKEDGPKRLRMLLENLPRSPPVALHILTTSTNGPDEMQGALGVKKLLEEKMVANCEVLNISNELFDGANVINLCEAVSSLARRSPLATTVAPPDLRFKSLRHYAEDFLCTKVFAEFYADLDEQRRQTGKVSPTRHLGPAILIATVNSAVEYIKLALQRQELEQMSWPIPELCCSSEELELFPDSPCSYWNDAMHLEAAITALDRLILPDFTEIDGSDWDDIAKAVGSYFSSQVEKSFGDSSRHRARIAKCLIKCQRKHTLSRQQQRHDNTLKSPGHAKDYVAWTEIIHIFVDYRLSCLATRDEYSPEGRDMVVGVYDTDLEDFSLNSSAWRVGGKRISARELSRTQENDDTVKNDETEKTVMKSSDELEKSITEEWASTTAFEKKLKSAVNSELVRHHNCQSSFLQKEELSSTRGAGVAFRNCQSSYKYQKVVACLSPSLAALASPLSSRLRLFKDQYAPGNQSRPVRPFEHFVGQKRRWQDWGDPANRQRPPLPSMRYPTTLDDLKERIDDDLDASFQFEKRLKEAAGNVSV